VGACVLGAALFVNAACGGGGRIQTPTAPSPSPPSTPAQPVSGMFRGTVDAFQVQRQVWTAPQTGTATITLTWSGPADLDLYLAPESCASLYPKNACNPLTSSTSASGTRESVSSAVQAGQRLVVFVDNLDVARSQAYAVTTEVR